MTDPTQTNPNVCYRHPDRQSWVLCQRCGRTICPACQRPAAVGVHCPECVREAIAEAPRVRRAPRTLSARGGGRFRAFLAVAPVTWTIIALNIVLFVIGLFTSVVAVALVYQPINTVSAPWTLLTMTFVNLSPLPYGIITIALNTWVLALIGPQLERSYGWWRYLVLYLLSVLGASVATLLIPVSPVAFGASGPVFGLFAALIWLRLKFGGVTSLIVVLAINLVINFIPGANFAWPMTVGGIIVGLGVGWVLSRFGRARDRGKEIGLLVASFAVLVILAVVGAAVYGLFSVPDAVAVVNQSVT